MKYFFPLLLFLLTSVQLNAQPGQLRGKLTGYSESDVYPIVEISIVETGAKTSTDAVGEYSIYPLDSGTYTVKYHSLEYNDTIVKIKISKGKVTLVNMEVPFNCKYSKTKSKCPKCHKKDKVIPILYGLIIRTEIPGKKKSKKKEQRVYEGGCEITGCDPHWYCERDKVKF